MNFFTFLLVVLLIVESAILIPLLIWFIAICALRKIEENLPLDILTVIKTKIDEAVTKYKEAHADRDDEEDSEDESHAEALHD